MTYVIYDQFHWHTPDHIEVPVTDWETALEVYKFLKELHPGESLGLVTKEEFLKKKKSYEKTTNDITTAGGIRVVQCADHPGGEGGD